MRNEPVERILRLALRLAASSEGMTLDQMAEAVSVSRKTAERARDTLASVFPEIEYHDDHPDRGRRWRLPPAAVLGLCRPRAETIAAVETAARECEQRGEADRAVLLRDAVSAMQAALKPAVRLHQDPDLEALMEAEGVAMRPGPRPLIAPDVLRMLRAAILELRLVEVDYAGRDGTATRILCPYGILYGGRGWLVASVEGTPDLRLWRLDRISEIRQHAAARPARAFSLSDYAAQSFGVFQEEPRDVVLRFDPSAAEDAAHWRFHPTQAVTRNADGSATVRFRAGGMREMCWHLFTWGETVTIEAPMELRTMMAGMTAAAASRHRLT